VLHFEIVFFLFLIVNLRLFVEQLEQADSASGGNDGQADLPQTSRQL